MSSESYINSGELYFLREIDVLSEELYHYIQAGQRITQADVEIAVSAVDATGCL